MLAEKMRDQVRARKGIITTIRKKPRRGNPSPQTAAGKSNRKLRSLRIVSEQKGKNGTLSRRKIEKKRGYMEPSSEKKMKSEGHEKEGRLGGAREDVGATKKPLRPRKRT